MNDSAKTNQHAGAQDNGAYGQGAPAEQQPFVAPSPIAPNTPQINPAALQFNQFVGQGPAVGSVQPVPPQAQNGKWVPINAPVTGLPYGVSVGQPIQGADGQLYCYGAGATEFGSLAASGVKPIAAPSDIIQLPPIVQPIAMVPYTTMNQPLLQYNPGTAQQYGSPQMPGQFSYMHAQNPQAQQQAQQQYQQQAQQQYQQQAQQQYQQAGKVNAQAAYAPSQYGQPARAGAMPLPALKKSYRGLSFVLMLLALAVLVCTAVLPFTSWINMAARPSSEALPTYRLIASVFIPETQFYDVAASQVGYYAYGLIACAALASVMLLAIFIKNLIFLIKGKNPRCISVFSIIALISGIAAGVMIYLIQCGIDPTYSGRFSFMTIFDNAVSSDVQWGLNPIIVTGTAIILFILPLFAKKDAYFAPPPALTAVKDSNNIIRSY